MKIFAAALILVSTAAFADVKVAVGDISDKRTTGKFFAGLEINLKVAGPEMLQCKGMRVVIKEAKDDTGKALPERSMGFSKGGFEMPQKGFGSGFGESKPDEFEVKLELENPARAAKTVTIDGAVELLLPSKDPAAVITAVVAKEAGKALANEELKKAGATIKLKAVKGDDMSYTISDPNGKVASVEFCSADGKPLESNGRMSSGFGGSTDVSVSMRNAPPADAVAKIYLVTEKSMVKVPLALKNVALP